MCLLFLRCRSASTGGAVTVPGVAVPTETVRLELSLGGDRFDVFGAPKEVRWLVRGLQETQRGR